MEDSKRPNTYSREDVENGDFVMFVAQLPENLHRISECNLFHLWKRFQENERIVRNLETRADELQAAFNDLHARGFTLRDLEAFQNQKRGNPTFGYMTEDYVLPKGYKRADWQREGDT